MDRTKRPKLSLFHNLPSGGGIKVLSGMLPHLEREFTVTVHFPGGSKEFPAPPGVRTRRWEFSRGERVRGFRRLAAPVSLQARLRALDGLCREIAAEMNGWADIALVHNSMFLAAPPLLYHLRIPSVYFCYEYPRHIYEPSTVRRTCSRLQHLLLSRLRTLEKRMDRRAVSCADSVITLSSWMRSRFRDIYGRDSSVVRPGIDTDIFRPYEGVRDNMVLSVGALWPFKGHEMALEAVSAVPEAVRPVLAVVADREFPGYAERLLHKAQSLDVVLDIRKDIREDELVRLYCGAAAVLCCQVNEPYGLVPLEAMSCGTPVVAVDEGGFRDNVRNGENGILVKRDPLSMARALEELGSDRDLRERIVEGGRRFVTAERTREAAAGCLIRVLREMPGPD